MSAWEECPLVTCRQHRERRARALCGPRSPCASREVTPLERVIDILADARQELAADNAAAARTSRALTYLAGPYSHPERAVRVARFNALNAAAARLMGAGEHVYSPISHTHPIAEAGALPLGWDFWEQYDRIYLGIAKRVVVLTLDGWRESKGVTAEIAIAQEYGLTIDFMEPIA